LTEEGKIEEIPHVYSFHQDIISFLEASSDPLQSKNSLPNPAISHQNVALDNEEIGPSNG